MAGNGQDNSQWLSVSEETLFLHDGLMRVTDLVELPHDVNTAHEGDHEVVSFDSKSPTELSDRLKSVCGTHNNAYARLLEYRLNAVRGFWKAHKHVAVEEHNEREGASHDETIALLKKHGLCKEPEQAPFSTRVSLLLVLPLLQSQSRFDPSLCGVTAELLLNCLRDCAPLSLSKEPSDCLNGLENLLSKWLREPQIEKNSDDSKNAFDCILQQENAASAYVALACARGHLKTFIHIVHLLQRDTKLGPLPVSDILHGLLETEGGSSQPTVVSGNKHILCWGFEDLVTSLEKDGTSGATPSTGASSASSGSSASNANSGSVERGLEYEKGRSVSSDGKFLFMTNSIGKGLVKMGTGLHGTLRGYNYARNGDLPMSWVAFGCNTLLQRLVEYDRETSGCCSLAQVIDRYTLQPCGVVYRPTSWVHEGQITTVNFTSDGMYFYWLWCPGTITEKKGQNVYLDIFQYDKKQKTVSLLTTRVTISKKEEMLAKNLKDTFLARLQPYRSATAAATLVTLTGSDTPSARKDDASSTSCGVAMKVLMKTPILCDGTSLVFLTSTPGGSASSTARSLFGSSTSLSSLRSLATNLVFTVGDGQFQTRSDVVDAPTCALARGAPVQGMGMCYDVYNHMVWLVSSDWVDQLYSPGHHARHHTLTRLGMDPQHIHPAPPDNRVACEVVVQQLLQHVGAMCVHQLNNDLLHTPLGCCSLLQQHPVDMSHLDRVCDILQHALEAGDTHTITTCLIILQLMLKMNVLKGDKVRERSLVERTSALLWQILNGYKEADPQDTSQSGTVLREACNAICSGINVLYPELNDRHILLYKLLSEGDGVAGLSYVRDLVLMDYAEQLRTHVLSSTQLQQLRLTDDLVHYILKIAVKESCVLLRQCQSGDKQQFEIILASVPMATPCSQYMQALQSHLLREAVLHTAPSGEEGGSSPVPPGEYTAKEQLLQTQSHILRLAGRVFSASYQVLEVLLETCHSVISSHGDQLEYWLQGLERVTKATILGHLLPVLVTAMTHEQLRCLALADHLMPQLVQLVILTSQAALLLKSQVQAIRQDDILNLGTDTDIVNLISQSVNFHRVELKGAEEEEGFLAGLKIPAPWTTGKTVESIHPVRDNYKFKETVHIPGARCLFLRFDPRCSSQYDYDKLVVYAGPNSNSRKVQEYGGNTLGYGSRSVLGSGWPKDLVKVEGDNVTFVFEMRSGREHNTPDKAMWGFQVTVRAQESPEEVSHGLPYLADLALGLSVLACTMLHLLYQGPDSTRDEDLCRQLLRAKLLHRCVWRTELESESRDLPAFMPSPTGGAVERLMPDLDQNLPIPDHDVPVPGSPRLRTLPRIKLPMEIVKKLKELSEWVPPQMRPSIKEVIQPRVLEECILSAAIKHLGLLDTVRELASHEEHQTDEFLLLKDVLVELYRRIYAMIRQLQSIAELEQKWTNEVDDVRQGMITPATIFFADWHLVENKNKEVAILCFLRDIAFDPSDLDKAVSDLREKLESEVAMDVNQNERGRGVLPRTRAVVDGLVERLTLLLQVTIAPETLGFVGMPRSVSHMPDSKLIPSVMVRSDTDVLRSSRFARSMSMPTDTQDDSILEIVRLQKRRQASRKGPTSILQDLVEQAEQDRPPHIVLLDQLFSFIGSNPEKAVSCESFLAAARVRWKRGRTRQQALVHMKELLTAATRVGGATHLVSAVTSVLQHGPRVEELTCGGMANQVREAFAETMTSVVQLAARHPIACCNSIGLLCTVPYTRAEEKCLVRSGLLHLLDHLCGLTSHHGDSSGPSSEAQSTNQRVSAMAWAGFQVLSNRCVTWEQEDGGYGEELEHSGLARQVSTLLTNHLARATEVSGNHAAGSEALQEVLSLLNNLSRSKMGKAILCQPGCVAKLLSLLLDQRPSPKLVLIILQLCRVALPLMSADDCDVVDLPTWGQDLQHAMGSEPELARKPVRIASLLLAKLGDFLIAGGQTAISSRRPSQDLSGAVGGVNGDKDAADDLDVHDGRLAVFLHKREDQTSQSVIQPLLNSESRPFRLSGGERLIRMDKEMVKTGKAEVTTEDAVSALCKAAKWAQMGLVVSTGPPVDPTTTPREPTTTSDKKKIAVEVVCKEKNADLARTDPVRPFISSHVASSMAAEVIALLHSLLTAPEVHTVQTWARAVEKVMTSALSGLYHVLVALDDMNSPRCSKDQLMSMAKLANAALAALGGFDHIVKPGCQVQVVGEGVCGTLGQVLSVSEQTGLACVQLMPATDDHFQPPRYSDTIHIPISRLQVPQTEPLPMQHMAMTDAVVAAVQALLLPAGAGLGSPLAQPLPTHGSDGASLPNQVCRVVSQIRTRACKVLSSHLKDFAFASAFIQNSSQAIDVLKSLAKECNTGDRLQVVEAQCHKLRQLYRDCAKPPPPPNKLPIRTTKEIVFDTNRAFPAMRACMCSHAMVGVTFLGDPSAGAGLPRGTLIYATQAIPHQAPSFYWEIEICSLGDPHEDSGPAISFGFMPAAEKKDGAWTNPVGACLVHNNGRAVHYNGSSLLQWRSVRLDITLNPGDVAGIGWERNGDSPPAPGQNVKGQVYFTYNGARLVPVFEDVAGNMWPVVHIQKKNTRIRANFGAKAFSFAEGAEHRKAADDCHDVSEEIRETFGALPFHMGSDSDSDGPTSSASITSDLSGPPRTPPGPPCRTAAIPRSLKEYDSEASQQYKLFPSYENFVTTGPAAVGPGGAAGPEDESDSEDQEEDTAVEDHYALLVKAWEQRVFPIIRRRFRNEAERKDGLEQIRGALQLGMTDIARQTVEFLYEENGGMPRDLHLPTIDDIKEELSKFTIERVRKGTTVVIRSPSSSGPSGTTVVPKYAVRGMLKTFGLTGVVLDIDQSHELVQVETYLRSEGVLVRYWYPLDMLERPPQGYRKASASSTVGSQVLDTSSIFIHRELLRSESVLARMHCRRALLELINQCNSPAMDIPSCTTSLSTMAASAALLQELDVENLQLLSTDLLVPPELHGGVVSSSLVAAASPWQCVTSHACSFTDLFYRNSAKLTQELKIDIARAANQGEDYIIELSNQICMCLQTAPEMFPFEVFPVTESKLSTDIHFPEAAFLVVSCKADPKAIKKDTSLYKSPWARIFTYRGHRVKKTGQITKHEVVCYPRDITSSSNQSEQYAPIIIPANLIHIRVGVSPPPGIILSIHGIPQQFPLAATYIETLVSQYHGFEYHHTEIDYGKDGSTSETSLSSGVAAASASGTSVHSWASKDGATSPWRSFDSVVIAPSVLQHVTELLGAYLWCSDIPAVLKEPLFHLLAQTLRMLSFSESGNSKFLLTLGPQLSSSLALFGQLQCELQRLYEEEMKRWPSGTTASGLTATGAPAEQGRFSTYFHALMEVCLAIAEVTSPILSRHDSQQAAAEIGESKSESSVTPSTSTSSPQLTAPTSPMSIGKRKKLKAKRERDRNVAPSRRSGSPRRTSESDGGLSTSPQQGEGIGEPLSPAVSPSPSTLPSSSKSKVSMASTKPEEMLWFHRALAMSQVLRHLVYKDAIGQGVTSDAVTDALYALSEVTAHQRLLVVTGINTHLDTTTVRNLIQKSCSSCGGEMKSEVFVPDPDDGREDKAVDGGPGACGKSAVKSEPNLPTGKPLVAVTPPQSASATTIPTTPSATRLSPTVSQPTVFAPESPPKPKPPLNLNKGYAVLEVRAKTKLDCVRKSLLKSKTLMAYDQDSLVDIPDHFLSVISVNQPLITEPEGCAALEDYLLHKLVSNLDTAELTDNAGIAFTEIFHSCFISEQRLSIVDVSRHSEAGQGGYICLNKEQIMIQTPGNMLSTFFNTVRPIKKTFNEQVGHMLRRYGVPRVTDKDDSDKKARSTRKSTKPSPKERMAFGASSSKTNPRDRKLKAKESAEKVTKEATGSEAASKVPVKEGPRDEDRLLTLDGFLSYVAEKVKQDVRAVWRGLLACGFDIHFERCACIDRAQAQQMSEQWTPDMDAALVHYVNTVCRHLAISPSRLHPHEVHLTDADLASMLLTPLQGVPVESLRLRYALLQSLNTTLQTFFLPLVDLRPAICSEYSRSIAKLLANARHLIFYDTKVTLLNRLLNATAQRKPDQAAPEITLDPLENVGGEKRAPMATQFCQALRQLAAVPSSQLCVRLAAGGDPTYAFNVRLTGEEVHGTSGSFRQFLWQVARELESSMLDLFMPCPSATTHRNRGKYILKPGPITYPEERLLQFFGQLMAVTVRAEIPFGLDLLPVFWKNMVGLALDPVTDLQEADILTYSYIKKFEMAESEDDLMLMFGDQMPRFVYTLLNGEEHELIPNGKHVPVRWENRQQYVDCIRAVRMEELVCGPRMQAVRSGMATVVPLQLLSIMTPLDTELRMCGLPEVNLDFLKAHTMYQVGLMETDTHIQFFWHVLDTLSQEDLCKFIKFSCNQERIPQTCPCRHGNSDTAHVPPYPMKIAPPDGTGAPDSRYIRVETCMFMVKLPQYSTPELMRDRLLYAIHCREDPLSG